MKLLTKRTEGEDWRFQVTGAEGWHFADLFWADKAGPLEGWTEFARIPISSDGTGSFCLTGGRAVPPGAENAWARAFRTQGEDFESAAAPLPCRIEPAKRNGPQLTVLADLHLTKKPWRLRQALRCAAGSDAILLLGDLVNDGAPEQFELFRSCIESAAPSIPVLAVSGNHDYPVMPLPTIGSFDFPRFQDWLFSRLGQSYQLDRSGAFFMNICGVDIIGLNAGSHWRKLGLLQGGQLEWLRDRLSRSTAAWRVICCHAPLLKHSPQEAGQPYMRGDKALQEIIDKYQNVIYLSGHLHLSCNGKYGCVAKEDGNIYGNLSSLCPSVLRPAEASAPSWWTAPAVHQINFSDDGVEFTTYRLEDGCKFPRGYYRF